MTVLSVNPAEKQTDQISSHGGNLNLLSNSNKMVLLKMFENE